MNDFLSWTFELPWLIGMTLFLASMLVASGVAAVVVVGLSIYARWLFWPALVLWLAFCIAYGVWDLTY